MKKEGNELVQFLIGIVMLAVGLYWFSSSVMVTTGFYDITFGSYRTGGGLVVVPLIIGICWVFANPRSIGAKIVVVLGVIIILASIIAGTKFIFYRRNLYEYIIMLIFIFGGASMTLKVLLSKPKD